MRVKVLFSLVCFAAGTAFQPGHAQDVADQCTRSLVADSAWAVTTYRTIELQAPAAEVISTANTASVTSVDGILHTGDFTLTLWSSGGTAGVTLEPGTIVSPDGQESPPAMWQLVPVAVYHGEDEIFRLSADETGHYAAEPAEIELLASAAATPGGDIRFDFLKPDGKGPFIRMTLSAQAMEDGFSALDDALAWLDAGCPAE